MKIHRITPEDIPAFFKLNEAFNGPSMHTVQEMRNSLKTNRNEIVLIAYSEHAAVGFICGQIKYSVCYERPSAEITELFVAETYRRQGIASQLMKQIERLLHHHNVCEITLATSQENIRAQKFYQQCGYVRQREFVYSKEGVL